MILDLDKQNILSNISFKRMGHAIQNSMALLNALHDQERTIEMVHCCVGTFNTTQDKDGNNCAILIGKI